MGLSLKSGRITRYILLPEEQGRTLAVKGKSILTTNINSPAAETATGLNFFLAKELIG